MAYKPQVLSVSDGGTGVSTSTGLLNASGTSALTNITFVDVTSWSPNVQFGGANVGLTYTTQSGGYVRFGNMVYFWINILLSSKGSSSGNVTISNFPFTIASTIRIPVNYWTNISTPASDPTMYFNAVASSTTLTPSCVSASGGGVSGIANTNFTNTSGFATSGVIFI